MNVRSARAAGKSRFVCTHVSIYSGLRVRVSGYRRLCIKDEFFVEFDSGFCADKGRSNYSVYVYNNVYAISYNFVRCCCESSFYGLIFPAGVRCII